MVVYVLAFSGVKLHYNIFRSPEQTFNPAHFFPGRTAIRQRHANMTPAQAFPTDHTKGRLSRSAWDEEAAIITDGIIRTHLPGPDPEFIRYLHGSTSSKKMMLM